MRTPRSGGNLIRRTIRILLFRRRRGLLSRSWQRWRLQAKTLESWALAQVCCAQPLLGVVLAVGSDGSAAPLDARKVEKWRREVRIHNGRK